MTEHRPENNPQAHAAACRQSRSHVASKPADDFLDFLDARFASVRSAGCVISYRPTNTAPPSSFRPGVGEREGVRRQFEVNLDANLQRLVKMPGRYFGSHSRLDGPNPITLNC